MQEALREKNTEEKKQENQYSSQKDNLLFLYVFTKEAKYLLPFFMHFFKKKHYNTL